MRPPVQDAMELPDLLEEIRSVEEALHRPAVRRSREALERLLAEGFVEFGSSGAVYQRAPLIDRLQEEESEEESRDALKACDYALTPISADAVLLTYRTHHKESDGSERHVLRSSIWKRTDGRWQMLFHQGTPTKPAA